ncbi:AzlD domain-containing protein [Brochothrix campestris]|uniref:Branched-chain amino acid transport protein AzlD n=1 Tax=Brochothrix campestris FSL F6-1037 TaxID=1265861 RepID=W7D7L6_9LIST|nr:AzlD domain-containing protein [Brochothrix campestris]EUJ41348.1 branched-chain amino acid transport protein AzlD [Brochothrix campestris FSL F6-1037]
MLTLGYFSAVVVGAMLVTIIPRVLPFILATRFDLPPRVVKRLQYIPVCLFGCLIVENLISLSDSGTYRVDERLVVALLTLVIALKTKKLLVTVLFGILLMAGVRFLF